MSTFTPISQRIRNIRRYGEILEVLVRYGFDDVVSELRLDRFLDKGRGLVGAKPREGLQNLTRAGRLRGAMEELGPTFIKMGQVLSTRPDLIPPEWAQEFKRLQDDCPRVPFAEIKALLEEEFGDEYAEVIESIEEEPLAAASMAQVHRAKLRNGASVVLKVLRPGIREVTNADLEILRTLAEFAENHFTNLGYNPEEVVREFARELGRETDLTQEARATDRLRQAFIEDEGVHFPRVYWEATTENVLALEEIHGVLLSRIKDGDLSEADRKSVVANGARAVLRQCLDLGFFHADPHPGNLFALPGGRICFIDCGMTGQLDLRTSEQLAELVQGVVTGDADRVIGVVQALADADPAKLDDRAFRSDVRGFISHFEHTPLERLNMSRLLDEFFEKLRAHQIKCPGDLVLLIKALSTIESVGTSLDPEFEMVDFVKPHVERLVRRRYGVPAMRKRLIKSLSNYTELVEKLPDDLRFVITQFRRNRFAINLEHKGLAKLTSTIEHASRNIAFALIIAAMFVGSSILVLAARETTGLTFIGIAGFVAAAILTVLIVISNRRRGL